MPTFAFDNTYARDLPGASTPWRPAVVPAPRLLFLNDGLAAELGLDPAALRADAVATAALFAGNTVPTGAEPVAQVYAGHQFGGFSPQLGDGRALLLGEVIDRRGERRDIAYKGSGRTPYSRGGDGKAAVGPMLREALVSEAMHALGIPTTRALAVTATGEQVRREVPLPGAVLMRVAASHLRVGTFQFFAARNDVASLRRLVDYAIARHDPDLVGTPDRALGLLRAVARRQAALVARWVNVGFIHGVMNTDNVTLSGETIDYGPCAFLEAYDPLTVFSSIDHGGRYAYANQPEIARWNIARFAETLLPLMAGSEDEAAMQRAVDQAMQVIDAFPGWYAHALLAGQRAKLGLLGETGAGSVANSRGTASAGATTHAIDTTDAGTAADAADASLVADWLGLLQAQAVDFTLAWRRLCDAATGDDSGLRSLFAEPAALAGWLARWRERSARDGAAPLVSPLVAAPLAAAPLGAAPLGAAPLGAENPAAGLEQARRMRLVNPALIPRNHRVEEALTAASANDDLAPFDRLLAALRRPFDDPAPADADLATPAGAEVSRGYQTYCGT